MAAENDHRASLARCIERMRCDHRSILSMRLIDRMWPQDAATAMKLPFAAAEVLYREALASLRSRLKETRA